jgi:hypothetical protein
VDLIVVRENTESLYAGIGHQIAPGVMESVKVITARASRRIARFAFELARREGRKGVAAIHKASIMRLSDGLFLQFSAHGKSRGSIRGSCIVSCSSITRAWSSSSGPRSSTSCCGIMLLRHIGQVRVATRGSSVRSIAGSEREGRAPETSAAMPRRRR